MIYRGQTYGAPVGEWWTTSLHEAEQFAMAGSRTWIVLSVDEDDEAWLATCFHFERAGSERGTWYRIPIEKLHERWFAVRVHSGQIALPIDTLDKARVTSQWAGHIKTCTQP